MKHGLGAVRTLADEVKVLGLKRPLIVTDPGIVQVGLLEHATVSLKAAQLDYLVFDTVIPNPPIALVDEGASFYKKEGCVGLIALGGVGMLALRTELWVGVLAIGLVGVGTTMLTTYLFPAYVARTPPEMLARFSSLTQLAQTGPVLVATPLLGAAAGVDVRLALAVIAVLLLATVPAATRVARLPEPAARQYPAGSDTPKVNLFHS
jgi:hypothetical protein